LCAGLAGGAFTGLLWRRRGLALAAVPQASAVVAPGSFELPEPSVAPPPAAPRLYDDARSAATELSVDTTCPEHAWIPTTWNCATCGRAGCESCPKSSDHPPCCARCVKAQAAAAPDPRAPTGHLVFVVVWNEARAKILKKCEMWRENESVEVFGRTSALAPLDAPPPMGGRLRMVLDRDGQPAVVVEETPPGGFFNVEDGQVLRPGDRLKNNQRFQWHRDGRVFEVIYK